MIELSCYHPSGMFHFYSCHQTDIIQQKMSDWAKKEAEIY